MKIITVSLLILTLSFNISLSSVLIDDNDTPLENESSSIQSDANSHYKNFRKIQSIREMLVSARSIREELNCHASEILVCFDIDNFTVAVNGGSDPLEKEVTTETYRTLMSEGFKVIMLTARCCGSYKSHIKYNLIKSNQRLHSKIADTSKSFPSIDRIQEFKIEESEAPINLIKGSGYSGRISFPQYGYYIDGILYGGFFKAEILNLFLDNLEETISYAPKAVLMGDDGIFHLKGFMSQENLRNRTDDNVHLFHMPEVVRAPEIRQRCYTELITRVKMQEFRRNLFEVYYRKQRKKHTTGSKGSSVTIQTTSNISEEENCESRTIIDDGFAPQQTTTLRKKNIFDLVKNILYNLDCRKCNTVD